MASHPPPCILQEMVAITSQPPAIVQHSLVLTATHTVKFLDQPPIYFSSLLLTADIFPIKVRQNYLQAIDNIQQADATVVLESQVKTNSSSR